MESDTGNLVKLDHIKLNTSKLKTLWDKADEAKNQLKSMFLGMSFSKIFVEESAKRFAPGFSSADTLFTLAKFNGIISYVAREITGITVTDINVNTARKILGLKIDRTNKSKTTKEKVREQVMLLYPNLPLKTHVAKTGKSKGQVITDKAVEDELDSFVVCKGGLILTK